MIDREMAAFRGAEPRRLSRSDRPRSEPEWEDRSPARIFVKKDSEMQLYLFFGSDSLRPVHLGPFLGFVVQPIFEASRRSASPCVLHLMGVWQATNDSTSLSGSPCTTPWYSRHT